MLALPECFQDLLRGCRDIDAGHVEPRRHDLVHRRVGQRKDAEQHVALGNAKVGLQRPRRVDEGMEAAIGPREEPEQRAERGQGAAREWQRRIRQLGRDPRHAARECVTHDKEEQGADYQGDDGLRPRPGPPGHRIGRGNRAQDEQRQARHVQRAMQRHAPLGGYRGASPRVWSASPTAASSARASSAAQTPALTATTSPMRRSAASVSISEAVV